MTALNVNATRHRPRRLLREWRFERGPSQEGPRIVVGLRDGATMVIAPPGTRIRGLEDQPLLRWCVAWWPAESGEDLDGIPPLGGTVASLSDVLLAMPQRVRQAALALHRTALPEQRAALERLQRTGEPYESELMGTELLERELEEAPHWKQAGFTRDREPAPVIELVLRALAGGSA